MLNIKNVSQRGIGYACNGDVIVIEPGETKPVPLTKEDARIVGDLHVGSIEIGEAATPAPKPAAQAATSDAGKGQ